MREGTLERAGHSPQVSCPGLLAARFLRSVPWVGLLQAACRRPTLTHTLSHFAALLVRRQVSVSSMGPIREFVRGRR